MDAIYFIIRVTRSGYILAYMFSNDTKQIIGHDVCFCAKSARSLSILINSHAYAVRNFSISHAMYIGKELNKAEIAMILNQAYIQN